jgi:hypothetical protein
MTSQSRTDRMPAKARSRSERARYNGRSREARAVRRLADELKAALGDVTVDDVTLRAIQRAAELGFIASDLRARRLRGEAVDVAEIVKAENAVDRAVRRLGLDRKREPTSPSLAEYLAANYAATPPQVEPAEEPAATMPTETLTDEAPADADSGGGEEAA